ncbi:MAG: efflux RND transporter periplasmic adaptor subunit [Desulfobacterales bacterium]|nr:efflux RND transporter periplasmic adaptor subunit [Desulfobacterales bacterium]
MSCKKYFQFSIILSAMVVFFGCQEKLPADFAGSGTLEATEVTVGSLVSGTILQLTKEEGDRTEIDELLAVIDVEKLVLQKAQLQASLGEIEASRIAADAAIAQASDNLENVQIRYKRIKELFAKGSATQQQFDDITTQFSVARSQLTAANSQVPLLDAKHAEIEATMSVLDRQIKDGTVISPLDATVVEKYVEPGEIAIQGGALYKLADLGNLWIKIYVAETDVDQFILGQDVLVRVDASPDPFPGKVSWISPEAEFTPKNVQTKKARAELVYAVKVILKNRDGILKIGMPAEVHLIKKF